MFENIAKFFRKLMKAESQETSPKETAKERLHLVLMQDRANVSADFLEMMKQEIIEVIKKYIDVDENAIDVRLTNKANDDGTNGAPALYANIPIISIKEKKKEELEEKKESEAKAEKEIKKEVRVEEDKVEKVEKTEKVENETSKESEKEETNNNINETNNQEVKENKEDCDTENSEQNAEEVNSVNQ